MRKEEETYHLIESYLNNTLSQEEKALFEKELLENNELSSELELHQMANESIINKESVIIKEKLQDIHNTSYVPRNTKKDAFKFLSAIAALLVLVLLFYFFKPQTHKNSLVKKENTKISSVEKRSTNSEVENKIDPVKLLEENKKIEDIKSIVSLIDTPSLETEEHVNTIILDTVNQKEAETSGELKVLKEPIVDKIVTNTGNEPIDVIQIDEITNQNDTKEPCDILLTPKDIVITNSCSEKPTGKIIVNIKADEYSIDGGKYFQKSSVFKSRYAGTNDLMIRSKGCQSESLTVTIGSYKCNFVIQPTNYVYWEVPLSQFKEDNSVELTILSARGGQTVFKKQLSESYYEWNGKGLNGELLPMGAYNYILKGSSSNKLIVGSVTLVK